MTTDELNAIVKAVMDELEKAGVDFDFKAETPQADDLVYVMRGTADKYQGITVKWQNLLGIIVQKATEARDEAVSAKDIALQTLASIQGIESNVSSMKSSVETMTNNVSSMKASVEASESRVTQIKAEAEQTLDEAQQTVSGKADKTYVDGELAKKADITYVDGKLANKADKSELAVERARIDSLSKLSEGSTTGDAELIDLRIGADGVTYGNAGTAVRTQISDLKGDLDNLEIENYDHVNWKSILDEATITYDKYAEKSGDTINIVSNTSYKMYEYDLTGISKVKMNVLNFYNIKLFFLDNDNKILAYYPSERVTTETMTEVIADVPSNASKMVTSITTNRVNRLYAYKYVNEYNMTADMMEKMSSISNFEKLEIEGYQKESYIDCIDEAELHNNVLAEMINGSMSFTSNSSYKYYVINVEKGKKFKTTGFYGWDMRPAIYTDDNDKVIDYYPLERVTTPSIITVETTAPEGATRLYVCAGKNTDVEIKTESVYFSKIESALEKQITVNINTNETLDTTIITGVGNRFRQKAEVLNNTDQPNSAILPRSCEVYMDGKWKTIVNNEDDNCPVDLASGYIGAGHGYDRAYKLTLENHGKTYADIGSEWKDTDNVSWYIVRIIDENNFVVIGQNFGNNYDTIPSANTGILTHVLGAVNTDSISGYSRSVYLITPIDKNHVKKILLDGISEVSENGTYKANNYVDLIDEYDIINPQTIVPQIQENKPSGGYTENPPINTGGTFLHMSNVYRYLNDGTLLIFTTLDNDTNVSISYWGATQYAQKSNKAEFGGKLFRYVPKLLPVDGYDLRTPFNMENWNFTINATTNTWEDSDNPPDRLLHLFTDANDMYVAGYAVGYLPLGLGEPSIRKNNVNNAMFLYNSMKMYPHLIDNGGTNGSNWAEYTPLQSVCYRKPVLDVSNIHTDAYFVPYGDKCYMYVDYHAVCDDRVKVPSEYVGKPMRVLEKSDNVTVYGTITTDEVRVRVSTSSLMYGYAVVEIG